MLVAVDDYNALHGFTAFGKWETYTSRRALLPGELRLASALRILEADGAWGPNAVLLGAVSWTKPVPKRLEIPLASGYRPVDNPLFSQSEAAALVGHLAECQVATLPRAEDLASLYFLSQGDGRRVYKHALETDYCPLEGEGVEGLMPGLATKFAQAPFGAPAWGLTAPGVSVDLVKKENSVPPATGASITGREARVSKILGHIIPGRK